LPLEYPRKPEFGPVQVVNSIRYRTVTLGLGDPQYYVKSIEVLGDDSASETLNAALRQLLPPLDEEAGGMLNVRREAMASSVEGGYRRDVEVSIVGHLLWFQVNEVVNGYHRLVSMSEHKYIFDTRTGKPASLLAWFKGGENMEIKSPSSLPPSLAEFVYSKIGTGGPNHLSKEEFNECDSNTPEGVQYNLGISGGKIQFSVGPASNGTCWDTIEIPFAELKPYLNNQGKAALAEIAKGK
jgi:hypothetical protein